MDQQLELIHQRNRLLIKLLWFSLVIGLVSYIISQSGMQIILSLLIVGSLICLCVHALIWRKVMVAQIKYVVVAALGILTALMMALEQPCLPI
ncbi:hypothetical protein [Brevibacillus dissolubilis]|uniref:hypothetical protein n=1 Tax=Brevibacillus dissolubilis TaxID=1844116 RepID=UPI001116AEDE|nr:hypothetical protein [Brevibacillus dissolubilis]